MNPIKDSLTKAVVKTNEPQIIGQLNIEDKYLKVVREGMRQTVTDGTARSLQAVPMAVAGKTGTAQFDAKDLSRTHAWFVGYTPRYITGTWVGFDEEGPLGKGETGSRAASPIWLGFMKRILADKPIRVFQVPEGVVFSKIDAETGLLPIPESKKVIFECFKEGTAPSEYTKKPNAVTEPEEFYKQGM